MKHSRISSSGLAALLFAALVFPPTLTLAQNRPVSLPPQASEIAHGIYDLGLARDANGTIVQGFAFLHYHKGFVRPEQPGKPKLPKADPCYAFLASGAKWKVMEGYVVDQNDANLLAGIESAIGTWEEAAYNLDILGPGTTGEVFPGEVGTMNGINEVMFGNLDDQPGVVAMTTVWGVFGGPPANRELVEWDMVFGTGWGWSFSDVFPANTGGMDFLNIATHEIGHALDMDHPRDSCTEETMYAYADWGETKKRDLNAGDIAGIQKLYP